MANQNQYNNSNNNNRYKPNYQNYGQNMMLSKIIAREKELQEEERLKKVINEVTKQVVEPLLNLVPEKRKKIQRNESSDSDASDEESTKKRSKKGKKEKKEKDKNDEIISLIQDLGKKIHNIETKNDSINRELQEIHNNIHVVNKRIDRINEVKHRNLKPEIVDDSSSDTEELDLNEFEKEISLEKFSEKYKGKDGTTLLKRDIKEAGIKLTKFTKSIAIQKLYENKKF